MNQSDSKIAENLLNRLFRGSSVSGLRFYTPQLLLDGPKDINQEGYVNLSSEWEIFDSEPESYPESIEELPLEKEELKIHALRGEEVERFEVLSPWPHLVIHFKSGKVLFMNGKDHQYEPWTAGLTGFGDKAEYWQVIACPGGGLSICAPEGRASNENV